MVTDCRMQTAAVSVVKAGRCWAMLVVALARDPVWPGVVATVVLVVSVDGQTSAVAVVAAAGGCTLEVVQVASRERQTPVVVVAAAVKGPTSAVGVADEET